jgi:hypothetical protein
MASYTRWWSAQGPTASLLRSCWDGRRSRCHNGNREASVRVCEHCRRESFALHAQARIGWPWREATSAAELIISASCWSTDPYRLPGDGLYLCSASTPPGGGVHGMCGYHAGRSALKHPSACPNSFSPVIAFCAPSARPHNNSITRARLSVKRLSFVILVDQILI